MNGPPSLALPPLAPWLRNLLIGLFALYALELILRNGGVPIHAAAWQPFESGFAPWQPLTRFLVQQTGPLTVVFGLLTLYFLLPAVLDRMPAALVRNALGAGALGGSAAILALDLVFADRGSASGWIPTALVGLLALFGLSAPRATIYLMFLIPVHARFLYYATGVFSALTLLVRPTDLSSAEGIGVFAGVVGWWYGLGPGARRRHLKRQARHIERELRRFEVIEGGRSQGGQGNGGGWIH